MRYFKAMIHKVQSYKIRKRLGRVLADVMSSFAPIYWKRVCELSYWKGMKKEGVELTNDHYKHFYTAHFGLEDSYYKDKIILDIGCGPRGSLEWATMAQRRIGLDPLAREYLKLNAQHHKMEYLASPAESIPLQDAKCDVVCSFNSLDHVENVKKTVDEIKRVTRPGGIFLLLVEVNHPPTHCEPNTLSPRIIETLAPEFTCESLKVYRIKAGLYQSIYENDLFPNPSEVMEKGVLSGFFRRI